MNREDVLTLLTGFVDGAIRRTIERLVRCGASLPEVFGITLYAAEKIVSNIESSTVGNDVKKIMIDTLRDKDRDTITAHYEEVKGRLEAFYVEGNCTRCSGCRKNPHRFTRKEAFKLLTHNIDLAVKQTIEALAGADVPMENMAEALEPVVDEFVLSVSEYPVDMDTRMAMMNEITLKDRECIIRQYISAMGNEAGATTVCDFCIGCQRGQKTTGN